MRRGATVAVSELDEVEPLDPKQADEVRDEAMLLDVREPNEWQAGHIEGSVHIPMSHLGARQDELPRDRLIVAVCRSGNRSAVVTNALLNAGYQAENLDGGLYAWVADGRSVVTDDGDAGRVI